MIAGCLRPVAADGTRVACSTRDLLRRRFCILACKFNVCAAPRLRYVRCMSNVRTDRTIEHDWSPRRVPENVTWGEGFYCESAQCFLHFKGKRVPAIEFGNHVSVYAACQFEIGRAHV